MNTYPYRFGSRRLQKLRWQIQDNLASQNAKGHGNRAAKREAMLGFGRWCDERDAAWYLSPEFARDIDRMAERDRIEAMMETGTSWAGQEPI